MNNEKLKTIINLFEGKEIRSVWSNEKEDYYFSVVDVIVALTNSVRPRKYWNDLKSKLQEEGSEVSEKIGQFKMFSKDGKLRTTDVLDTEGIFRLIESVPSPNAEPFKIWLARLGRQEVDNIYDPSIGVDKMIDYYIKKGYTLEWIEARIKAIITRKKLTKTWNEKGIQDTKEYAILTNEIYKTWSGMKSNEYKKYKGLKKENLRDNMTDIEIVLNDLGEITTRELTKKFNPKGLEENKKVARIGGEIAKNTRTDIESKLGEPVINRRNNLKYQHSKDKGILIISNIK